ncbi:hypothetical protein RUR49_10840 [Pseudoxanthobacter sp. M-2]
MGARPAFCGETIGERPMDIPYPLAIALVAATYGFIAVGTWVM